MYTKYWLTAQQVKKVAHEQCEYVKLPPLWHWKIEQNKTQLTNHVRHYSDHYFTMTGLILIMHKNHLCTQTADAKDVDQIPLCLLKKLIEKSRECHKYKPQPQSFKISCIATIGVILSRHLSEANTQLLFVQFATFFLFCHAHLYFSDFVPKLRETYPHLVYSFTPIVMHCIIIIWCSGLGID